MNMIVFGKLIYSPTSTHDKIKMKHIFRFSRDFPKKKQLLKDQS